MIKLLIIDDERLTREGLRNHLPWHELGIGMVETARNGIHALEMIKTFTPDVILCDVRMPKMNGIELAKRIRELRPRCKIIFLSGYSDKEYLKSAIHLQAVDYLEKPINLGELSSVVISAVESLSAETEKRSHTEKLEAEHSEHLPLIKQDVVLELIQNGCPQTKQTHALEASGFASDPKDGYTVVCALLNWQDRQDAISVNIKKREIIKLLNGGRLLNPPSVIAGFTDDGCITLIMSGRSDTIDFLTLMKDALHHAAGNSYSFCIGKGTKVETLSELPASYRSARTAASMQFYYGHGMIITGSLQGNTARFTRPDDLLSRFAEIHGIRDKAGAMDIVSLLAADAMRQLAVDIDSVKNAYFDLLTLLMKVEQDSKRADCVNRNYASHLWQEINTLTTLSELSEYLTAHVDAFYSQNEQESHLKNKILDVTQYIGEHFCERDMSLQSVSENAYISKSYLCAFFKKEIGKTVNQYICELRMEKAKALLLDRRKKVYEIALSVGYTDVNYFLTLFKKTTGTTTSQYRGRRSC